MSLLFNSYGKLNIVNIVNNRMCTSQVIIAKVILAKNPNLDPGRASMLLNLGFSASLAKLKGSKRRKKGVHMLMEEATKEVVQTTKRRPMSRQDLEAPRYRKRSKASCSSVSMKSPPKSTPVKTAKRTVVKKIGRNIQIQRRESLTKDFMLKIANTRLRALARKQPLARGKKSE